MTLIYLLVHHDPYSAEDTTDIESAWSTREAAEAAMERAKRAVSSIDWSGIKGFDIEEVRLDPDE